MVGKKSMLHAGVLLTVPGFVIPGHFTSSGTRVPPSYRYPLPSRKGALMVEGVFGPSSTLRPPLSEVNRMAV